MLAYQSAKPTPETVGKLVDDLHRPAYLTKPTDDAADIRYANKLRLRREARAAADAGDDALADQLFRAAAVLEQ